jgi:hypothetical protein
MTHQLKFGLRWDRQDFSKKVKWALAQLEFFISIVVPWKKLQVLVAAKGLPDRFLGLEY